MPCNLRQIILPPNENLVKLKIFVQINTLGLKASNTSPNRQFSKGKAFMHINIMKLKANLFRLRSFRDIFESL